MYTIEYLRKTGETAFMTMSADSLVAVMKFSAEPDGRIFGTSWLVRVHGPSLSGQKGELK